MKKISSLIVAIMMIATVLATAGNALPWEPMALTNRAALASLAIRHIDHYVVAMYNSTDSNPWSTGGRRIIYNYENQVKSILDIMDDLNGSGFVLEVADKNQPVYVDVSLVKGEPQFDSEGVDHSDAQTLLYGYTSGDLVESEEDGLYVMDNDNRITLRLSSVMRFELPPGTIAAKAIHMDGSNAWAQRLYVMDGEGNIPTSLIGNGLLILGIAENDRYQEKAFSFVTGTYVPLTEVHIRLLLELSEEIQTFINPTGINLTVDEYEGYGINPLLVVKFPTPPCPVGFVCTSAPTTIPVLVKTTAGIQPSRYIVIDLTTKNETTVTVPAGMNGVNITFLPNREYHIIPVLALKTSTNGGHNGGGKAGGGTGGGFGNDAGY